MSNKYDEDDIDNSAFIPSNFDESGRLFNGTIKLRNAIEAGVLGFVISQIVKTFVVLDDQILKMSLQYGIAGTIGVFALIGYQGDSLTQTILMILKYFKDRRKMRFRRIKKIDKGSTSLFGNKKVKAKNKKKKNKKMLINKKKNAKNTKDIKKSLFSKSKKKDINVSSSDTTNESMPDQKNTTIKEKNNKKRWFKKKGDDK